MRWEDRQSNIFKKTAAEKQNEGKDGLNNDGVGLQGGTSHSFSAGNKDT